MRAGYESWGRFPRVRATIERVRWRHAPLPDVPGKTMLPYGNGRSYGDSCLNPGGVLIDARGLDRFISFDETSGILRCEAGVLLRTILDHFLPRGWVLPVVPGTGLATVGGAIANDVHGKNHHQAGSFGCHVRCFELLRSDQSRTLCSPSENVELYRATIGGLGLTGLIVWAEIGLRRVPSPWVRREVVRCEDLASVLERSSASATEFEHTVAWLDCLCARPRRGRGLLIRANYAETPAPASSRPAQTTLRVPFEPPVSLVRPLAMRVVNALGYHRPRKSAPVELRRFFFPLDGVGRWNLAYGRDGLLQYQCVIPPEAALEGIKEIFEQVSRSGIDCMLAVLKVFGEQASPGILSFPRAGVTLALDFANEGGETLRLLDGLDAITRSLGGAVYPAKDARMSRRSFQCFFPQWEQLGRHIDPCFSSGFWRRVTE